MNDLNRYLNNELVREKEWEARCARCGACCGALEDPCENLRRSPEGKYFCSVYDRRFGTWHTISGKELNCVPIRINSPVGNLGWGMRGVAIRR